MLKCSIWKVLLFISNTQCLFNAEQLSATLAPYWNIIGWRPLYFNLLHVESAQRVQVGRVTSDNGPLYKLLARVCAWTVVWLKQCSVGHCVACCHWKMCNSCLIKTVPHCSLCGVLLLKRVYWLAKVNSWASPDMHIIVPALIHIVIQKILNKSRRKWRMT